MRIVIVVCVQLALLLHSFYTTNCNLYPIKYVVNPYRFCPRAMENPHFYGGDMILPDLASRFGTLNDSGLWPNKEIPYEFDWNIQPNSRARVMAAMETIQSGACVRFVQRTDEENYLRIYKGRGCYSHVGFQNIGEHVLSLGSSCYITGIILHELMHVIGCFHEHERPDRNKYLTIIWRNVDHKFVSQFRRIPREYAHIVTDFDYWSIMMYGSMAFSGEPKKVTIVPKQPDIALVDVWRKVSLTDSDYYKVNKMYECEETD